MIFFEKQINQLPVDVLFKNNNPFPMIGRAGGPLILNDK